MEPCLVALVVVVSLVVRSSLRCEDRELRFVDRRSDVFCGTRGRLGGVPRVDGLSVRAGADESAPPILGWTRKQRRWLRLLLIMMSEVP